MKSDIIDELRELAAGPAAQNPENIDGLNMLLRAVDEITRLRSIVEPLEALLKCGQDKRGVRVLIYTGTYLGFEAPRFAVEILQKWYIEDTLPEALAAAQKAAEGSE